MLPVLAHQEAKAWNGWRDGFVTQKAHRSDVVAGTWAQGVSS